MIVIFIPRDIFKTHLTFHVNNKYFVTIPTSLNKSEPGNGRGTKEFSTENLRRMHKDAT